MLHMVRLRIKRVQGNTGNCSWLKDQLFWSFLTLFCPKRLKASMEGRVCISTKVKVGKIWKNGPSPPPQAPSTLPSIIKSFQTNAFESNLTTLILYHWGVSIFLSLFCSVLEMNEPISNFSYLLLWLMISSSVPSMNNSSKKKCLLCSIFFSAE